MKQGLLFIITLCVFASAFSLMSLRHAQRHALQEWQVYQTEQQALRQRWRQLQLEHSVLTQPDRIEPLAREQLNMHAISLSPAPMLDGDLLTGSQ